MKWRTAAIIPNVIAVSSAIAKHAPLGPEPLLALRGLSAGIGRASVLTAALATGLALLAASLAIVELQFEGLPPTRNRKHIESWLLNLPDEAIIPLFRACVIRTN